jgi:PAS domain S-box-containing protein
MTALPPMRREILIEVLKIVFLSGALSLSLIISIYFSGKNPKSAFFINFQSINSILVMSDSLDSLFLAKNHLIQLRKKETDDFEMSLQYLEKYNENNAESDSLKKIRVLFENYKSNDKNLGYSEYIKLRELLRNLIKENQKVNSKIIIDRESFATKILILSCIIFLLALSISVYFSEKLSGRIAQPIKKISEILQHKPSLGQKLKFPQPENLEIKILIIELNDLWKRLGDLNNTNVKNLSAQRNELDTVFDTMEDAIFILDHLGKIEHHNKVFSRIMGAKNHHLNFQPWNDVSLSSLAYIQLRNLLRKENFEEADFFANVDGVSRIYHVRKRIIYDGNKNRCGTIYILHEVTNTLSSEKFSEISLKLQEYQSKYE